MILIRDFSQEKKRKKRRGLIAIILVLIWLGFYFYKKDLINISLPTTEEEGFQKGQEINILGKIKENNHFPSYTHSITQGDITYGLKSASINIKNYMDQEVTVGGQIEDTVEGTPVINVNQIYDEEQHLFIKNNKYVFTEYLLMFDFSDQPELRAEKSGENIIVYYQGSNIMKVEGFTCTKVTASHDCEKLVLSYQSSEKDNFVSFVQQTFYRHEKTSWITFNDSLLGYIFKPENDQTLLDVSHLIYVVNEDFLMEYKKNLIDESCKDSKQSLVDIEKNSIEILDENLIRRIVVGETDTEKKATCKVAINIGKNRKVEDITRKLEE